MLMSDAVVIMPLLFSYHAIGVTGINVFEFFVEQLVGFSA